MLLTLGLGAATMAFNDLTPKIFGGYPEVANEQSEFGTLKTDDNKEEEEQENEVGKNSLQCFVGWHASSG